jgi:TolA-binding protein
MIKRSSPLRLTTLFFFASVLMFSCKPAKEKLSDDIKSSEAKLFADSMKSLNKDVANDVLLKYVAFADKYKDDTLSAEYLFRAGDLANGLHRPEESIALYERLRVNYPDFRKAPAALFMQAFIYETVLQNKEKAKQKYSEFINKYPNHHLVADAAASLQQLNSNMSDEDLIKMFEEKNKGK